MRSPEFRAFVSSRPHPSKTRADRSKNRRRALASLVAAIAVVDCTSRLHATTQTSTWVGGTSAIWSTAANWNPNNTFPNNGNGSPTISDFDVVIPSVATEPYLTTSVTIDDLTLNTGATLDIIGTANLTLNGSAITDDGTITINSNNSNFSTMTFAGGTVSGTGTITLNSGLTDANLTGTLTQSSGHTIDGFGSVTAAITNNGTVDASVSGQTLTLSTSGMTNNSLMEATGSSVLSISGITITQGTSGQISASGGTVDLVAGTTISGGTLITPSGSIQVTSSSTDTLANVTNNGTVDIVGASNLNITGNLTDNGAITVNSNNSNFSTMTFAGGTVSGTGTITLNSGLTDANLTGTLTQSSGHTINGYGTISAAITNNGTVDASVSGDTLTLQTSNMTNNSVMEATGGAVLSINGITLTQVSPGQVSASGTGSLVTIVGSATISGGTLNTSSGGIIQLTNSSTDTLASVTNNATVDIVGTSNLDITGNLVNNGLITVNSGNSNYSTMSFAGGTLSGTGTITLNSGSTNANLAGTLIQSSGHTINGYGTISAALTNNGLVNASSSGQTLFISGATVTNTSTMEATAGVLVFNNSVAVTNTNGTISAAGGNILFNNASITGGTLKAVSPNLFQVETATFNGLTVAPNTTVDVLGSYNLTLTGSSLTNDGNIVINPAASNFSTLQVNSNDLLTGSGSVTLSQGANQAVIATGMGDTLTQDVNHSILGYGEITGSFINNGTVSANVSGDTLTLITSNMTNKSGMGATGGGILSIDGITLTQVGGIITASGTNSLVTLIGGATISGGTLQNTPGGLFQATSSSTDTLANVTNTAMFNIIGASNLDITGNLDNNVGAITVNSNNSNYSTMTFSGGTLSGGGTIVLNSAGIGAVLAGTLTQASPSAINGQGEITAALTNQGTVDADVSGDTLTLLTNNMTNDNVMEATGGGILSIDGITLTQSGGQVYVSNGSLVTLIAGATISGGTLANSSGGVIQVTDSSTDTLNNVTNNATLDIVGASNLIVTGTFADDNVITVNSNNSNYSTMTFSGTTLTGAETIILNSPGIEAVIAGTLTQDAGHAIQGDGEITAAMINQGTVNANVSGQALTLLTNNMTNDNLMEATGAGTLSIDGITVTQGTLGKITNSGGSVNIFGGATITGGSLNGGIITNSSGTNTIGGLTNNATLNVVGASNLNISSPIVNNGVLNVDSNNSSVSTVTASGAITGTGTITIQSGGKLAFATSVGGSSQDSLFITGSGTLDLNNNHMFINYGSGPDPIASIAAWIASGYAGGAWTGTGIDSSAAHANPNYGIGYADSADSGNPANLSSGQIEIAYTLLGDANLDYKVNGIDFNLMATNFNQAVTNGWDKGDFNYDGKVNGIDFNLLATNFNQFAGQSDVTDLTALDAFAAANGISLTTVPEPATAAILTAAGFGILRRRRKLAPYLKSEI